MKIKACLYSPLSFFGLVMLHNYIELLLHYNSWSCHFLCLSTAWLFICLNNRLQLFLKHPVVPIRKKKSRIWDLLKELNSNLWQLFTFVVLKTMLYIFPLYIALIFSLKPVLVYYPFYFVAFIISFPALFHYRIILDIFVPPPFFSILHLDTQTLRGFIFIFSHMLCLRVCTLW